jgi:hypothetical protein
MARNLILYKGGCPNLSDTVYIYATSVTDYANKVSRYLDGNSQIISADTYQISNNMLTLEDKSSYDGITYIIETDPADTDYIRCYFVNDVIKRSGLMIFTLSLDTFGTYISKMRYQYFNCGRSNIALYNSHIEVGSVVPGQQEITPIKSTTYSTWSADIICILYVTIKRADTFSNPTITTLPIAFKMSDLKTSLDTASGGSYQGGYTLPTLLSEVLGSITELIYIDTKSYQVTLNNAYLVPTEFLNGSGYRNEGTCILQSKTNLVANTLSITCNTLQTMKKSLALDIPTTLSKLKKHYLGTYLNNAEISLYTSNSMKAYINTSISKGAMQIEMEYGNIAKDLTTAFAIVFSNNNIQSESLSRMSNFIGLIASGATAVGGAMSGNPLAVIGGGTSLATNVMGVVNSYNQKPPKSNTATSADINYYWEASQGTRPLTYPIVIISYVNEEDTAMMANLYGEPCSEVTTDINSIINGTLIFPNDSINYAFVQGQFSNMKGIPQTAISAIQSAFNSGVKILR